MDGHPTRADLDQIKVLSGHFQSPNLTPDIPRLIEKLKEIWHWSDYIKHEGNRLELHIGGWSGNEEIIAALQSSMFWVRCWRKSERGGHFYFEWLEGE